MSGDTAAVPGVGLPSGGKLDLPRLSPEDHDMLRGSGEGSTAGSGDDAGSILARAAAIRFPKLSELGGNRARIDALIDHISDTAILRGEVEQLRLEAHVRLRQARERLDRAPASGSHRTKAAAEEARRTMQPEAARDLDGARWLVDRCTEAIARLGGTDYDAASRAYTLLSGG